MTTKSALLHRHTAHRRAKSRVKWWQQHWQRVVEWAGIGLVALALVSCVVQLAYPANQALPFSMIGGLAVGGKDRAAIAAQLDEYAQQGQVTITTPTKTWQAPWQSIGVNIDSQASADVALEYPLWERLIPFSALIKIVQSRNTPLVGLTDHDRLDAFAQKIVKEERTAATNATLRITDGQVVIDQAKNGYRYKPDQVKRQIQATAISSDSVLRLVPEQVPYVRSAEQIADLKAQAEAMLTHTLTLTVLDKTFQPDRTTIGSWIALHEDEQTKQLQLQFNRDAIKQYLESVNKDIAIDPGTITITLLDGQEVHRTSVPPGRSVAIDSSIDQIEAALRDQKTDQTVPLVISDVPPRANYVRTYSQTSAGLMAIVRDWEATHYGDFGVIVREIGGQNRYAEWQPDKQFVTASTFKLFVYYAVAKKIEAGEVSYQQMTDRGWTVEACLQEMIVNSTNPCATSLLNLVGWQTTQDMTAAAGFSGTFLNNSGGYGDKYSTVRDETNYMLRLNAGTLMAHEPTERLLGYLKRQIWRAGIPSGVPWGVTVANKVGFYNGWVHDIAIVYGPHSTYILGIMSRGGSDPSFAELSRRVYHFFNG